jgi:chorismate mutase
MSIEAYDYGVQDGRQEREDEIVDAINKLKIGNGVDDAYLDAIIEEVIKSGEGKK